VERFRYLITAGHVLDQCPNHCIEFPAGCARPNSGEVVSSNRRNSSNRNEDSVMSRPQAQPAASRAIEASVHSQIQIETRGVG